MKIKIKIHTNSSREKVIEKEGFIEIWVKEKPVDNKANIKLIKILRDYLGKDARIISGFTSKTKIVEVK